VPLDGRAAIASTAGVVAAISGDRTPDGRGAPCPSVAMTAAPDSALYGRYEDDHWLAVLSADAAGPSLIVGVEGYSVRRRRASSNHHPDAQQASSFASVLDAIRLSDLFTLVRRGLQQVRFSLEHHAQVPVDLVNPSRLA
jgi:hypothetical protein